MSYYVVMLFFLAKFLLRMKLWTGPTRGLYPQSKTAMMWLQHVCNQIFLKSSLVENLGRRASTQIFVDQMNNLLTSRTFLKLYMCSLIKPRKHTQNHENIVKPAKSHPAVLFQDDKRLFFLRDWVLMQKSMRPRSITATIRKPCGPKLKKST